MRKENGKPLLESDIAQDIKRKKRYIQSWFKSIAHRWIDRAGRLTFKWIWNAYSIEDPWQQKAAMAAAQFPQYLSKFIFKGLKSKILLLEGEEACTNQPFRLLYFGSTADMCIITFRFFGSHLVEQKELGECWYFQVKSKLKEMAEQADIIMVSRNGLLQWKPREGHWIVVPSQLRMVIDFSSAQEWLLVEEVMKRCQAYNIRKVRSNHYSLETSRDPQDLDFFISHMYLPYIQQRYKYQGQVASQSYLKELFQNVELKFAVCPDGQRVAGLYCYRQGRVAHWMYFGILDGKESWTEQGALAAIYYLGLHEAFEQGLRRVDAGEVRPFKDEKLYFHKKHWGFKPILHPWNYDEWLLWAPEETSIGSEWINNHAPIPGFGRNSKGLI